MASGGGAGDGVGGGASLGFGFGLGFALFTFFLGFFFAFFGKILHLQLNTIRYSQNIDKFWVSFGFDDASGVVFG